MKIDVIGCGWNASKLRIEDEIVDSFRGRHWQACVRTAQSHDLIARIVGRRFDIAVPHPHAIDWTNIKMCCKHCMGDHDIHDNVA